MYVCTFFSVHIAWPLKPDQQLCFPSPEPPGAHGRSMLGAALAPFPCLPPCLPATPAGWPRPACSRSYDAVLQRTGGGGLSPAEHLLSIPLECRQISWHERLSVMVPAEGSAASCPPDPLSTLRPAHLSTHLYFCLNTGFAWLFLAATAFASAALVSSTTQGPGERPCSASVLGEPLGLPVVGSLMAYTSEEPWSTRVTLSLRFLFRSQFRGTHLRLHLATFWPRLCLKRVLISVAFILFTRIALPRNSFSKNEDLLHWRNYIRCASAPEGTPNVSWTIKTSHKQHTALGSGFWVKGAKLLERVKFG